MMQLQIKLPIFALSLLGFVSIIPASVIADQNHNIKRSCAATAKIYKYACGYDVKDGYQAGISICLNVSNYNKRRNCLSETKLVQRKARQHCHNVYQNRKELCASINKTPPFTSSGESLASHIGVSDEI